MVKAVSPRRISQALKPYHELAADIVHPPFGGWSYDRGGSGVYGGVHFVMDGQKYTVFDHVKRVIQPLLVEAGETIQEKTAEMGILSSVVRAEVEMDVARTRLQMAEGWIERQVQ